MAQIFTIITITGSFKIINQLKSLLNTLNGHLDLSPLPYIQDSNQQQLQKETNDYYPK